MAPHSLPEEPKRQRAIGNFSAGPACLADWVMHTAAEEFVNKDSTGMGLMEMSHRDAGGPVQNCISSASDRLTSLLDIPSNYHVLFMQGGAHGQFAAVAMNLLGEKTQADYIITGYWSQRAANEASKYCNVRKAYDGETEEFCRIPPVEEWDVSPESAYVHICANETIHGLEYLEDPKLPEGSPPLVGDFTSTLLSRRINVNKYGLIYASGGKNLGPAGVTVVIVREDLVGHESAQCPSVLSYAKMAGSKPVHSIYNTPPTFLIYMVDLVLLDNMNSGGIGILEDRAKTRSDRIYAILDGSDGFYIPKCNDIAHRSRMNVPFRIRGKDGRGDRDMEEQFCSDAEKSGLLQLFCHPLFPGCRVTLYNGIPDSAVDSLCDFLIDFATTNAQT